MCGKPCDTFDLRARIWLGVQSMTIAVIFLALAKVYPTRQLPNDGEVDAATDGSLERRDLDEGIGGEVARSEIAERAHLFSETQEPLFGAHKTGAPFLKIRQLARLLKWIIVHVPDRR